MGQIIKATCKITVLKFDILISVRSFWSFCRVAKVKCSAAGHSFLCSACKGLPSVQHNGGELLRGLILIQISVQSAPLEKQRSLNIHTPFRDWLPSVFPARPQGNTSFSYMFLLLVTFLSNSNAQNSDLQISCDTRILILVC